ncbi:hypothetical protein EWK31_21180, partial [Salmonella enterica subsp. enterica serovar Muenchen]|nr:hypothetical protein [Salmonella enterica subsp. enterica serovar Muenchen]
QIARAGDGLARCRYSAGLTAATVMLAGRTAAQMPPGTIQRYRHELRPRSDAGSFQVIEFDLRGFSVSGRRQGRSRSEREQPGEMRMCVE